MMFQALWLLFHDDFMNKYYLSEWISTCSDLYLLSQIYSTLYACTSGERVNLYLGIVPNGRD